MSEPRHDDDLESIVDSLFCRKDAPYTGFARERGKPPLTLVPGRMFRVSLLPDEGSDLESGQYEATVFLNMGGFAGTLWESAARTLVRLGPIDHPALPTVEFAKAMPERHLAFTLTKQRRGSQAADFSEITSWARDHPAAAFEQFMVLLDAVRQLHGSRILHRRLVPDAIRMIVPGDAKDEAKKRQLLLGRFEMSMIIGNLIRRAARDDPEEVRQTIQWVYLHPEGAETPVRRARHLAYLAPEMHDYLLSDDMVRHGDWETTDMFGLGVLGWELFCGPLPDELPLEFAAVGTATGKDAVNALADLHAAMRDRLRRDTVAPQVLRECLMRMIDHRPDGRWTSFEVAGKLNANWDSIYSAWTEQPEKPYLVAYMPEENVTLHDRWGWVSRSPEDPAGREEMQEFFRDELSEASLVHSLRGAQGYATGDSAKLRKAEWVLIGRRAVWFCSFLEEHGYDGRVRKEHEQILLVRYIRENSLAKELYNAQPRRDIPAIDVIEFEPGQELDHLVKGRPSWQPLVETLKLDTSLRREDRELLDSLDFLLEFQRVQIDARVYPYTVEQVDGTKATLRFDPERDHKWRTGGGGLMTAYTASADRRAPLGEFADQLDEDEDAAAVYLQIDHSEMPRFTREASIRVKFDRALSADSVLVDTDGRHLMRHGWLRPDSDVGDQTQLARQVRARQALQNQRGLIRMLRDPVAFDLSRGGTRPDNRIGALRGNAGRVIRDMLRMQPIYVLQGPPGSGKTTAAAHAVRQFLEHERGARILVSAQSNFALDNLAARLIKELPHDQLIVLRETPEQDPGKRVRDEIKPYMLHPQAEGLAERIAAQLAADGTHGARGEPTLEVPALEVPESQVERQLREQWAQALAADKLVELTERIRGGASVVLATCSIAAAVLDRSRFGGDTFDWVILEEAAKAWPTELIVPLVLGTRWALIGDHQQLGAHRADVLGRFLESLRDYPDPAVRQYYTDRAQHMRYLRLFASFFEPPPDQPDQPDQPEAEKADRPGPRTGFQKKVREQARGRLDRQFRMHPAIAQPVSRTFYRDEGKPPDSDGLPQSFLQSDEITERSHDLTVPEEFKEHSLIWLNTNGVSDCLEVPRWYNPGEVQIINDLVGAMRPEPADAGAEGERSLVVLTPYRAQLEELNRKPRLAGRNHTVHSFQGREADRVIVSLVRARRVSDDPLRNVGHVGQAEVINVLLSRARRLMVLVGNLEHFEYHGGKSWADVTKIVRRYGLVQENAGDWGAGT
jgi:RecA/RadA recombinase